jgi:hypothetical protein
VAGPDLDLEPKLRPLADPLLSPRPGDWLAEHIELGQTFAEYLDARPVRKSDKLTTIYLCLVGEFSEAQRRILALTQDYLLKGGPPRQLTRLSGAVYFLNWKP